MKREIEKKGILFCIGNQTPRRNEYERGQKYRLFVIDAATGEHIPTSATFHTIKAAREYVEKNYFLYM